MRLIPALQGGAKFRRRSVTKNKGTKLNAQTNFKDQRPKYKELSTNPAISIDP
jgi:hypothetical protein